MSTNTERVLFLDVARSIAVLWIVGYWHLRVYCGKDFSDPYLSFPGDRWITNVVLGLFMSISGVLISKYTFVSFWKDCISFYKRRFTRFYLLYAISIILLYVMGYNSIFGRFSIITSLTMTSTFLLPQPRTLWFFSMIASFYLFTPFILKKIPNSIIYSFITIYGGSIFLMLMLPKGIDPRFFWCFPLYFGGLYLGKNMNLLNKLISSKIMISISFLITITQLYLNIKNPDRILFIEYITLPFGIFFILYISKRMSNPIILRISSFIAYCSMCAYLFHREIYILLMDVYNIFNFNFSYWFSVLTFLPICFVVCYYIQSIYDKYISSLFISSKTIKNK